MGNELDVRSFYSRLIISVRGHACPLVHPYAIFSFRWPKSRRDAALLTGMFGNDCLEMTVVCQ